MDALPGIVVAAFTSESLADSSRIRIRTSLASLKILKDTPHWLNLDRSQISVDREQVSTSRSVSPRFAAGSTAETHRNQSIFGQQRSTLRSGTFFLKNGKTLATPSQYAIDTGYTG